MLGLCFTKANRRCTRRTVMPKATRKGNLMNDKIPQLSKDIDNIPIEPDCYVVRGIEMLGSLVANGDPDKDPCSNSGASFKNDIFEISAYCWCDGERHPDGCPPNFKCGDFSAEWYKHVNRGFIQSRPISALEWVDIMIKCLGSLGERHKNVLSDLYDEDSCTGCYNSYSKCTCPKAEPEK